MMNREELGWTYTIFERSIISYALRRTGLDAEGLQLLEPWTANHFAMYTASRRLNSRYGEFSLMVMILSPGLLLRIMTYSRYL